MAILFFLLNHSGLFMPYGICVNIFSGNGLLPDITKPLPEPIMEESSQVIILNNEFEYYILISHLLRANEFNSLRLSDAYMHQWNRPSLVQMMACCLLGTKPSAEQIMFFFCQLEPYEQTSVKL